LEKRALTAVVLAASLVLIAVYALHNGGDKHILVYLPAAGKKVWERVVPIFERETGIRVDVVYGSSGKLLEQAYLTRKGDVLGSATPPYMNKAVKYGIVYKNTVKYVACMLPAILTTKGSKVRSLEDLTKDGIRIAMCDPESCAVGKYFKYMLEKMGLWDKVKKNVVVYTVNFSRLVTTLLMGNVDAALGWNVAAYWYPDRIISINLKPLGPYKPCITIAILKSSSNLEYAKKFENFLLSDEVSKIFENYGYLPPREAVK